MIMKWDPQAETGHSRKITDRTGSKSTKILTPLTGPLPKKNLGSWIPNHSLSPVTFCTEFIFVLIPVDHLTS